MKKIVQSRRGNAAVFTCLLLAAFVFSSCTDEAEGPADGHVSVGMSLASFKTLHPGTDLRVSGEYRHRETVEGLPGEWTYAFRDKKLAWYVFNAYEDEISREKFDQCRAAADFLIERYRKLYGPPDRTTQGLTEFADPAAAAHTGYEVLSAEWQRPEESTSVRFSFIGDGLKYSFLVTVEGKRP